MLDFRIEPIALTLEQIEKHNPPPNPAKKTDPRAKQFIEENGSSSWEVDALKPQVLNKILEDAIVEHLDLDTFNSMLKREKTEKEKIS